MFERHVTDVTRGANGFRRHVADSRDTGVRVQKTCNGRRTTGVCVQMTSHRCRAAVQWASGSEDCHRCHAKGVLILRGLVTHVAF